MINIQTGVGLLFLKNIIYDYHYCQINKMTSECFVDDFISIMSELEKVNAFVDFLQEIRQVLRKTASSSG